MTTKREEAGHTAAKQVGGLLDGPRGLTSGQDEKRAVRPRRELIHGRPEMQSGRRRAAGLRGG